MPGAQRIPGVLPKAAGACLAQGTACGDARQSGMQRMEVPLGDLAVVRVTRGGAKWWVE